MRPEGAADELAVEVISLFNESAVPVLKVTSSDPAAAKTYALEMGPFKLTLVCKEGVDGVRVFARKRNALDLIHTFIEILYWRKRLGQG